DAQHRLPVRPVALGHGTLLHVLAGPAAQLLDVADERSRLDHEWLLIVLGHGVLLSRTPTLQPRCQARGASACNGDAAPRLVDAPSKPELPGSSYSPGPIDITAGPLKLNV